MEKGNKIFLTFIIIWCIFVIGFLCFNLTKNRGVSTPCKEIIITHDTQILESEPIETVPSVDTPEPALTADSLRTLEFEQTWSESAIYMAKTIWGEARGCSADEQRKVGWCILNRVDNSNFPNTIIQVIVEPEQFHGYSSTFPCTDELYELSMDIIANWQLEKLGEESNRNLGADYLYFCADESGIGNIFRKEW